MIKRCSTSGASQAGPAAKSLAGIALCAIPFLASAQFAGPQINISPGDCTSGVHLVARDARLSDVFERLSESLAFQLQFEANTDSVVNVNLSMPAPELIAKLSPVDSVIVSQTRDPRCPRRYRIDKVWVLPKAKGGELSSTSPTQTAQEPSRRFDEMSRQAKEAYQAHVLTYGRPPPGAEEEIGKPR